MRKPSPSGRFTRWASAALQQVGPFETQRVLSAHGPVASFLAQKPGKKQVRLTVLDPQIARHEAQETQFLDSARLSVGLKHPNLIQAYELGKCEDTGLVYVVSEHAEGQTLDQLLAEGRIAPEDAIAILQPIVEGLAFASHKKLAHGGIHPGVILLDEAMTPRLLDLGIVKPQDPTAEHARCLAPEQVTSAGRPGVKVDLYALGVVLYRCLTGAWPFDGDDFQSIADARLEADLPDPRDLVPSIPEGVAKMVGWLAAREPRARYQVAHTASLDLLRILAGREPLGPAGARLKNANELCELLLAVGSRGGDTRTPRGLWGKGSAYAFKAQVYSRGAFIEEMAVNSEVITVGRNPDCEVQIDNPTVSRKHVRVRRIGGHFLLEPLSKTNSTVLGNSAIEGMTWFKPGVAMHLSEKFRVRLTWAPGAVRDERSLPPKVDPQDWIDAPTEKFNLAAIREAANFEPIKGTRSVARPKSVSKKPTSEEAPTPKPEVPPLPPLDDHRLRLVYERRGQEVKAALDRPFQIGHATSCDLRLGQGAGYKVAMLVTSQGEARVYNLTPDPMAVLLNDDAVHDQALVEPGDRLVVQGVALRVEDDL